MARLKDKLSELKDKFRKAAKLDKTGTERMRKAAEAARQKTTQTGSQKE